jgi:PadR family transcriptional regulator, regulatory protein PadR
MTRHKTSNALLHGTLDALILKTLAPGPRHGYGIARSIENTSDDAVVVEEGSLYPALYRLERRGWVVAEWATSELGRRAKFYRLTQRGRTQLAAETEAWRAFAAGVSKILLAQ